MVNIPTTLRRNREVRIFLFQPNIAIFECSQLCVCSHGSRMAIFSLPKRMYIFWIWWAWMFIFSLCTLNTGYDYDKFIEKYTGEHEVDEGEADNSNSGPASSMNQVFKHILLHNQLCFFCCSCFHPNIVSLMCWPVVRRADGVGFSERFKNVWNQTNPRWRTDLSSKNEFSKPDSQSLILKTSAMLGRSIAAWKHRTEDVGKARPIYRSVLCILPICTKLFYAHKCFQ